MGNEFYDDEACFEVQEENWYSSMSQPFIDLDELISPSDDGDTIAIEFQDKRTFTLEGSQFTGDGQFTTKGRLPVSWQGMSATFS